jgi:hypothetical protein
MADVSVEVPESEDVTATAMADCGKTAMAGTTAGKAFASP